MEESFPVQKFNYINQRFQTFWVLWNLNFQIQVHESQITEISYLS